MRGEFGREIEVERLGPDFGVTTARFDVGRVATACSRRPLFFMRHLTVEADRISLAHLRPGALAVVTLKLGARRQPETASRCLDHLAEAYQVLHARQLHHNRHEVTIVARRRDHTAMAIC